MQLIHTDHIPSDDGLSIDRTRRDVLPFQYRLENDFFETVERRWTAFHFHTENCALPGSQEEFSEVRRIKR